MRFWIRTSRHTGISLGPVALLVLAPFMLAAWAVYVAVLIVYLLGRVAVAGIEAAARWAENRQARQ